MIAGGVPVYFSSFGRRGEESPCSPPYPELKPLLGVVGLILGATLYYFEKRWRLFVVVIVAAAVF